VALPGRRGRRSFYGPKIDFKIKDSIGRTWQCSTLQVDPNLPERFKLEYVARTARASAPSCCTGPCSAPWSVFSASWSSTTPAAFPCGWPRCRCASSPSRPTPTPTRRRSWSACARRLPRGDGPRLRQDQRQGAPGPAPEDPFFAGLGAQRGGKRQVAIRRFGSQDSPVMALDAFVDLAKAEVLRKGKAD